MSQYSNPDLDELIHFGVLGMRWGVRKETKQATVRKILNKKGESVTLEQNSQSATAKFLGSIIPKIKENQQSYFDFTIRDRANNKIGNATLSREAKDEMNIVWIGINSKHEGRGHGQSAMRTILADVQKNPDIKKVTLEVPTTSPNARHIYEKLGFKVTSEKMIGDEDDFWGGLTKMELQQN